MKTDIITLPPDFSGGGQSMSEEKNTQVYDSKVISRLFGVSVRRIQQLTQEGIIETVPIREGRRTVRRYELVPTIQKYIAYLSEKAYGKQGKTEKETELKEKKMATEIALKESQTELHKLKANIASGAYISKEEVKIDYSRFFVVFKKFAMSLPSRISAIVSAYLDPVETRKVEKDIADEIHKLLTSFVVAGIGPDDIDTGKRGKHAAKADQDK